MNEIRTRKRSDLSIMLRLIKLVKPLAPQMVLAISLGILGHLCATSITVAGSMGLLGALHLDKGLPLAVAIVVVLLTGLLRGVFHMFEQYNNHLIAFKLLAVIRDHVFKALRRLSPAKMEGKDKGDLIALLTSDIELLEVFYAHTISPICIAVIYTIVMLIFFGTCSIPQMLVALCAYLVVGVLLPLLFSKLAKAPGMELREKSGRLSGYVLESMRGLLESLRYNNTEAREDSMIEQTEELTRVQTGLKKVESHSVSIADVVILFFDILMLIVSLSLYAKGTIGFGAMLVGTVAMMSSFGPVAALNNLATGLTMTLAAGERVLDILDEEPVVKENLDGTEVEFGGMTAEHVGFAYKEEEPILDDFNMTLDPGSIVSITGPSGSGKSTALKLMMRFWNVDSGAMKMSGVNVNDIKTTSLRDQQALVSQETQLFNDTIENNIKIAKFDATREEVEEAAKKASIHDFILTLPKGYDSVVGELGDLLSDGEKQRIGLARAFLADTPMILLDEPTSNLDSLNEGIILRSLEQYRKDKAIILVSHRKSTASIADKAYTVYNGRLS